MSEARTVKAKGQLAYAIIHQGAVRFDCIEPFTEEGHRDLVKQINRPAGESVKAIAIRILDN